MSAVLLFSVLLFRKGTVQSIFIHIPVHDNTQKQPPVGILLFKPVYFHSFDFSLHCMPSSCIHRRLWDCGTVSVKIGSIHCSCISSSTVKIFDTTVQWVETNSLQTSLKNIWIEISTWKLIFNPLVFHNEQRIILQD